MVSIKNIIKFIVNVKSYAFEAIHFEQVNDEGCLVIQFRRRKNHVCRCPFCHKACGVYDTRTRPKRWRTCDFNGVKVYIEAPVSRVNCPEHGVVVEAFPWASHDSEFTSDFDAEVAWFAAKMSKVATSELMRISWPTVGSCIGRCRDIVEPDVRKRYEGLENIGIDETSFRKGHKYLTVVVNHDTNMVVWAAEGHDEETLSKFFHELTAEQRSKIKAVSGDGARWIDSCVQKYCPQVKRCIDGFHVVQWVNDALNELRIENWRKAQKELSTIVKEYDKSEKELKEITDNEKQETKKEELEILKHKKQEIETKMKNIKNCKYALGKAPENLTESQQIKLKYVTETDKTLQKGYILKELIRTILKLDREHAEPALKSFFWKATHSRIQQFRKLAYKIRRHQENILNTIELKLSNARVEGLNRKIKGIIHKAYGFTNINNLISMIMLVCSSLKAPLAHRLDGGLKFG